MYFRSQLKLTFLHHKYELILHICVGSQYKWVQYKLKHLNTTKLNFSLFLLFLKNKSAKIWKWMGPIHKR